MDTSQGYKNISVQIPVEDFTRCKAAATAAGQNISVWVRAAIKAKLHNDKGKDRDNDLHRQR